MRTTTPNSLHSDGGGRSETRAQALHGVLHALRASSLGLSTHETLGVEASQTNSVWTSALADKATSILQSLGGTQVMCAIPTNLPLILDPGRTPDAELLERFSALRF